MGQREDHIPYLQILYWLTIGLVAIGLVMVYSASGIGSTAFRHTQTNTYFFMRQCEMAVVGLALLFCFSYVRTEIFRKYLWIFWFIALLGIVAVFIPHIGVRGNKTGGSEGALRWISLLGIRFQPSELFKLADTMLFAGLLGKMLDNQENNKLKIIGIAFWTLAPLVLILMEPDLGSVVLIGGIILVISILAGLPLYVVMSFIFVAVAAVVLYINKHTHGVRRLLGFLNPEDYMQDISYQIVLSLDTFASGGLLGTGIGSGEAKYRLPEGHTDYIIAVLAEEMGLVMVLLVLGAFLTMAVIAVLLAKKQRSYVNKFMILSSMSVVVVPALTNVAMAANLLPSKGLTLPFISYGGTSMIVSCMAIGILCSFARETEEMINE